MIVKQNSNIFKDHFFILDYYFLVSLVFISGAFLDSYFAFFHEGLQVLVVSCLIIISFSWLVNSFRRYQLPTSKGLASHKAE